MCLISSLHWHCYCVYIRIINWNISNAWQLVIGVKLGLHRYSTRRIYQSLIHCIIESLNGGSAVLKRSLNVFQLPCHLKQCNDISCLETPVKSTSIKTEGSDISKAFCILVCLSQWGSVMPCLIGVYWWRFTLHRRRIAAQATSLNNI